MVKKNITKNDQKSTIDFYEWKFINAETLYKDEDCNKVFLLDYGNFYSLLFNVKNSKLGNRLAVMSFPSKEEAMEFYRRWELSNMQILAFK